MARPRTEFKKELFYFWRHDPGKGALSKQEWQLQFEAHITGINDNSSPTWNEYFDMGRADPKVFFGGASRSIQITFVVVALDDREHKENYENLSKLGRMTYPIYQSGTGYNAPMLLYQVGNLLTGYGVITNLSYDWNPDYPWIKNIPLYTDVNLTIKVLANKLGERPNAKNEDYF